MNDIIFVSLEDWDEIWRRNQFFVAELARRATDRRILFVGLPINVSHELRHGKLNVLGNALSPAKSLISPPGLPNVFVLKPTKWLPNTLSIGRAINGWVERRQIRQASRKLGLKRPLLWLNPHSAVHIAGRMGECAVVYDITDDWGLATIPASEKRLIEAQDQALCRRADLVIVCSEALEESRRPLCRQILLLPNGVNVEHYRRVAETPKPAKGKWPAPVFGYTGSLHSDRIDRNLVIALARAFPQGSVVLVGPNSLDAETQALLTSEPNVHLPGPVPYDDIPDAMIEFDVCIVPHVESAFTESLNPIKLWEYLASGKPIVSSDVAGFRSYPHLCHIASGPEAFIAACQSALNENGDSKAERIAEAAKHTWRSRVDCLLARLRPLGSRVIG